MADEVKKSYISQKFRQIFITGVLACLPLVVTVYLVLFLYRLLTGDVLPIISKVAAKFHLIFPPYLLQFTALVIVFAIIFIVGLIARAYIGGKIFKLIEKIMSTIPIARTIYYGTKQVIDSFSKTSGSTFSKVVLIEFPRRDMWMIGFIVKDSQEFMANPTTGVESYNVFIPTAPNPTSGFAAVVAKGDVREIDISVEDGIKFVLSIGVVSLTPHSAKEVINETLGKDNKDVH